jgi:hypothetical protein
MDNIDWESRARNAEAELNAIRDRLAMCDESYQDMQRQYDVINQRQFNLLIENIQLKKIVDKQEAAHGR